MLAFGSHQWCTWPNLGLPCKQARAKDQWWAFGSWLHMTKQCSGHDFYSLVSYFRRQGSKRGILTIYWYPSANSVDFRTEMEKKIKWKVANCLYMFWVGIHFFIFSKEKLWNKKMTKNSSKKGTKERCTFPVTVHAHRHVHWPKQFWTPWGTQQI